MNEATPIVRGSISPENARAPDEATSSSISSFGVCSTFFFVEARARLLRPFLQALPFMSSRCFWRTGMPRTSPVKIRSRDDLHSPTRR